MKHPSLWKQMRQQWFLNGPRYAVFSHELSDGTPVHALLSPRHARSIPPTMRFSGYHHKRKHRISRTFYWAWREYLHGWRTQLAKPLDCGCTEYRGKRYVYCSAAHFGESMGLTP